MKKDFRSEASKTGITGIEKKKKASRKQAKVSVLDYLLIREI